MESTDMYNYSIAILKQLLEENNISQIEFDDAEAEFKRIYKIKTNNLETLLNQ